MDSTEVTQAKETGRTLRVWDVPVRIFHWALVVLTFVSWLTSEIGGNAMTYHMWSGYAILTLVVFRICWGFAGSPHARFRDFVHGPGTVLRYARDLRRPNAKFYAGYNPLGGWSVVCLLSSVLLQAITGLFANDDIATEGPLVIMVSEGTSALLTTVHRYNFYVMLTLVCLHVAAAFLYLFVKKENLIGAMFTGRKRVPANAEFSEERMASNGLALLILAIVAGAVAVVVNWK